MSRCVWIGELCFFLAAVNVVDYFAWLHNFGMVAPGAGSGENLPEPASVILITLWALIVGLRCAPNVWRLTTPS